ncbi:hypothetical protein PR048_016104 [Dryococelus australis]|uniref:Reverse transcriptase RNase H-like domain-containing protein n=1 Tax=Dryococelus australis TaxID=614101 RepID=A0ABQ9HIS8_9NEOP|nr:hypothetical protein PR048_016104 [Dryococelus australis]
MDSPVLVSFDPLKPLIVPSDVSQYWVGVVLSHRMSDGTERPICFVSKTLSRAEQGYCQLQREALSIEFAVQKFHKYPYGNHFTLYTDHRPLSTIFGPKKAVPPLAAAWLQHIWLARNAGGRKWAPVSFGGIWAVLQGKSITLQLAANATLPPTIQRSSGANSAVWEDSTLEAAERTVQSGKTALLKQDLMNGLLEGTISLQHMIDKWLFAYSNTPHTTTGKISAELFLRRKPHTSWWLVKSNLPENEEQGNTLRRIQDA